MADGLFVTPTDGLPIDWHELRSQSGLIEPALRRCSPRLSQPRSQGGIVRELQNSTRKRDRVSCRMRQGIDTHADDLRRDQWR